MEGERLGRVVAVALLALLTPVACAALGVGTPSVSGLPPSNGSASPAVLSCDGEEAPTSTSTEDEFPNTVRQAGYWAVPASPQPQRHARDTRVRAFVSPVHLVDHNKTYLETTGVVTAAPPEPARTGSTTETARDRRPRHPR
jgi:hypothetical protein